MDQKFLDLVAEGKCVLFLGAGASASSKLNNGETSPLGNKLAEKVYMNFYPDEQYSNESLAQLCSMVKNAYGSDKLHVFFYNLFNKIKPSEGLLKLPLFHWRNIYTTNIDQAIEESYKVVSDKAQELVTVVGPMDLASEDKNVCTTLYKLHGCISSPDVELVFSLEEYATSKEEHLKLFNSLSIDLVDHPVIFVGYSMVDSNFQELWSSIKKYCKTSTTTNYYYVGPFLKKSYIDFLEKEGFVVFNKTADDFFNELQIKTRSKRQSLNEYYLEHSKPVSFFERTTLEPEQKYNISKNYDFPSIEVSMPRPKLLTFYKGNEPLWGDIKYNLDAKRDMSISCMTY